MYHLPTTPLSIGQILDNGFKLFAASVKSVFLLAAISSALPGALAILAMPLFAAGEVGASIVIGYLVMVLVMGMVSATIIARVHGVAIGEPLTMGEAFGVGMHRAFPFFFAGILYGVVVGVGMVLLLVPGIIFAVSLMLVFYAVVLEGMGPIAGLKYSHSLVWGNWWRTAGVLTVITIIVMVMYAIIGLATGIATALMGLMEPRFFEIIVNIIITPVVSAVITPLFYALGMAIYYDLKLRHEGGDIAARIEAAEPA